MDKRTGEQTRTAFGKVAAPEADTATLIRYVLAGERPPRFVVYAGLRRQNKERR